MKKYISAFLFTGIFAAIIIISLNIIEEVPEYEAIHLVEFQDNNRSMGDCRIVNRVLALNSGFDIYAIDFLDEEIPQTHVIAVDEFGMVHDVSRGNSYLKPEKIDEYLINQKAYVYAIEDRYQNRSYTIRSISDLNNSIAFFLYAIFFNKNYI